MNDKIINYNYNYKLIFAMLSRKAFEVLYIEMRFQKQV